VQYFDSAELNGFETLRVTAQLEVFKLSLSSIMVKYELLHVVNLTKGHLFLHDILLYWDAAARLMVNKAISEIQLPFYAFIWAVSTACHPQQCCSSLRR
jgi:hypothetical protein